MTYTKTYAPTGDISGYAEGTDGVEYTPFAQETRYDKHGKPFTDADYINADVLDVPAMQGGMLPSIVVQPDWENTLKVRTSVPVLQFRDHHWNNGAESFNTGAQPVLSADNRSETEKAKAKAAYDYDVAYLTKKAAARTCNRRGARYRRWRA